VHIQKHLYSEIVNFFPHESIWGFFCRCVKNQFDFQVGSFKKIMGIPASDLNNHNPQ
jgi:hypothetical protein